jgi:hypothetical protein
MMATGYQHTAIVEMLLEAGARRDLYDKVRLVAIFPGHYTESWNFSGARTGLRDCTRLCAQPGDEAPARFFQ